MRRYTRKAAIALIIITLFCIFTSGCSKKIDTGLVDDDKVYKDLYKGLQPSTITMYFCGVERKEARLVLDEIENRTKNTLNIKLNFKWYDFDQYENNVNAALSSGSLDAFYCYESNSRYFIPVTMAREGKLKDITNIFPKYAPTLYNKYLGEELENAEINGKLCFIPSLYPFVFSNNLCVSEELLKKYSIPDIRTYDDYENFLKVIKENEKEIIPGKFADAEETINNFARAFDYVVLDEEKKLVYKWNDSNMRLYAWEQTPEFKKAMEYISGWYENGYIGASSDNTPFASILFYSQLVSETGISYVSSGNTAEPITMKSLLLYPDKKVQMPNPLGKQHYSGSIAFCESSSNTERVLMFLDWVQQSQENYDLLMYGIKDKHYILKENYPQLPKGVDNENSPYLYWRGRDAFRNMDYEYVYNNSAEFSKTARKDFLGKHAEYPLHMGFYPDYRPVNGYINSRTTIYSHRFDLPLIQGTYKFEDTDSIIQDLKNAGTDRIVTEIQSQLDKWRAQKDN